MFLSNLSDEQLVDELRRGNDDAFDCIYIRYRDRLVNTATIRLKDRAIGEELAQEVLTDLWERRRSTNIHTSLSAFLHAALRYSVLDYIRRQKVKDRFINEMMSHAEAITDSVDEDQRLDHLERSIDALPSRCKQIFLLNKFERLSISEISKRLNVSENTIKYHLAHAMKVLRSHADELTVFVLSCLHII
jgi:RNA polymerase sigma-70 factor (family 1)